MRIATTTDGMFAAAALHTGGCALFMAGQKETPAWTYTPPEQTLSLAYAVDITQTAAGRVVIACGTNQTGDGGFLYLVDSVPLQSTVFPTQWTPMLRWISARLARWLAARSRSRRCRPRICRRRSMSRRASGNSPRRGPETARRFSRRAV